VQANCTEENRHFLTIYLQSLQSWCKPRAEPSLLGLCRGAAQLHDSKVGASRQQNLNFAIAKLQSCQHIDNLNVNKMTFGNFASVKIVDVINNQNVILNFANFATI
jgi:hypothetical protein